MSSRNARNESASDAAPGVDPGAAPDAGQGPVILKEPSDSIGLDRGAWNKLLIWCGVLVGLGVACIPFDGPISVLAVYFREEILGGDIRRELESLQQYGQGGVTLLVAWAVWLLAPARRRRLLDWVVAAGLTLVAANGLKMLIGRPRPKFDDPGYFSGPFGAYPLGEDVGVRHAWEVWADISSDLWSMPSSHTAFAVVMSVVLWKWFPRVRPIAVTMAVLVAVCRVLFGAHYLSDVFVGAAVGLLVAVPVVKR